jgi:RNA polymerase sigma factor (sigma-70 family)
MPAGQLRTVVEHARRLAGQTTEMAASDRQLLARFVRNRDQDAFATLVDRHGPMVLGVCGRVLGHEHDAQDAFQGTFLVLARKAGALRWRASIASWLHGVAHRLALQVRESVIRQRLIKQRMANECKPKEGQADLPVRELCEALDAEMRRLPDRYRTPLVCCYLEGLTRDQAAAQCGWSLRTLDRRLQRGRELLRARLLCRGMSLPGVLLIAGWSAQGARATVPPVLARVTAGAAAAYGMGGSVPGGASTCAAGMADRFLALFAISKLKASAAIGALAALVVLGISGLASQIGTNDTPADSPAQEPMLVGQGAHLDQAPNPEQEPILAENERLPEGAIARFGTHRLKHLGNLMNMAFSPDGAKLASWSDEVPNNNSLCIWDTHTGDLLRRSDLHRAKIEALDWLQDGRGIAVVDTGHVERGPLVWEFTDQKSFPVVEPTRASGRPMAAGPPPAERSFAVSPDGQTLAVGRSGLPGADGQIDLRKLNAGVGAGELFTKKVLASQPGICALLLFTPDGKRLVAFSEHSTMPGGPKLSVQLVLVWEVSTGQEISRFIAPRPADFFANRPPVAVSNGALAIGLEDGGTSLWDLNSGKERRIATAHAGQNPGEQCGTVAIAFARDGSKLVTGGRDGLVKVWDAGSGRLLRTMERSFVGVESLSVGHDYQTIAAGYDGFIRLWDANSGAEKCPQPGHGYSVRSAVFSYDSKLAITAAHDNTLRWWDCVKGGELRKLDLPTHAECLILSPDGSSVLAALDKSNIRIWKVANGEESAALEIPGGLRDAKALFTANGRQLIVASGAHVHIFDWPALKLTRTIKLARPTKEPGEAVCESITVSPDSRWLITVAWWSTFREERGFRFGYGSDAVVDMWDLATGKRIRRVVDGNGCSSKAHFTPNGHLLLTDGLKSRIPAQAGRPAEAFSGEIALLDPFTPRWLRSFIPAPKTPDVHEMSARAQLSPDGRMLCRGYDTGVIRCFEVATGQLRRTLAGHKGYALSLSFSPDGRKLISGGLDGTVLIWDTSLAGLGKTSKKDARSVEQLWLAASGQEAIDAYSALQALAVMPDAAIKHLRQRFKPAAADTPQEKVDPFKEVSGEQLAQIRAVELLEGIGSAAAQGYLTALAGGGEGALLTREAKVAMERLKKRR